MTDPASIDSRRKQLLEPRPLQHLEELEQIIKPKPHFIGPGPWLEAIREEKPGGRHIVEK